MTHDARTARTGADTRNTTKDAPGAHDHSSATASPPEVARVSAGTKIVFVDTTVEDWKTLAEGVRPDAEVVPVGPESDGMTVMAETLAGRTNVEAVHILGHGQSGAFQLGRARVDGETLPLYSGQTALIRDSLAPEADLLLYGCETGAGQEGDAFIRALAEATGADVAASTDLTGAAVSGGDWDLEIASGTIESRIALNAQAQVSFSGVLATSFAERTGASNPFDGFSELNYSDSDNRHVMFGDFDSDGDVDGFLYNVNNEPTGTDPGGRFLLNDGSGNFTDVRGTADDPFQGIVNDYTTSTDTFTNNAPLGAEGDVFLEDFDNDGDLDVVHRNWNPDSGSRVFEQTDSPPAILSSTPSDGASGFQPGNDLVLTFDETISLGDGNIEVRRASDDGVVHTFVLSAGSVMSGGTVSLSDTNVTNDTLTLDPDASLPESTALYLHVDAPAIADADGAAALSLRDNPDTLDFTTGVANNPPTASGVPADVIVTEDVESDFDLSSASLADADGDSLTVTLTASAGTFTRAAGSGTITVSGGGTDTVTLAGGATDIETYLGDPASLGYTGAANASGTDAATFTINADDGTVNPQVASGSIDITAVNDAPTSSANTVTTQEDVNHVFQPGDFNFSDVDSGDSLQAVRVPSLPSAGTLFLDGGGENDALDAGEEISMNDEVTVADIAAGHLQYAPPANQNGASLAAFDFEVSDGTAFAASASTMTVDVTAVNDDPEITGLPSDVTATEDQASDVDLSMATLSDVDSAGNTITLEIAAGSGTLAASTGGGVTVGGSGSGTLTLTGAVADLDTFLNTASNLQYTGAGDAAGDDADTLTLTANDGGNTGTGGGTDVTLGTVNVDITAVNDAPTATNLTQTVTYTEDPGGDVALGDIVVTDPDAGDTLTATLTLNDTTAGALTTGAFGGTTSTYDAGTGQWTATGSVSDVNAALAAIAFQPAADFDENTTISTRVRDAADTGPAAASMSMLSTPIPARPTARSASTSLRSTTRRSSATSMARPRR